MKINKSEINRIKEDLEKEISQRNYTSLRYVLFNKNSKLSHATHLYYENNKYYIENRDERGELIGNPYTFEDSSKAKKCFFEVLGEVVALNSYYNNTFGEVPYDSPLWSKSSNDDNKIIKEQYEVFHPEKTKNESPIWLRDDVNITLVSSKLESRDRYKISTLKDNVSGNEVVCKGNKKHFYYPCLKSKPVKVRVPKGILKKGVGSYTFTTSQHL